MRESKSVFQPIAIGLLVLLIGTLNYLSGPEMEFGVVYLVPVLLAAAIDRKFAIVIAFAGAALSLVVDLLCDHQYSSIFFRVWDFCAHAAIFSLAAVLRSGLIQAREFEARLARTDSLTGALNGLAFHEVAEAELHRAQRYSRPFAVAYIDVDNFKTVNDTLGHAEGDKVLRTVAVAMKKRARKTDIIARLGGDEFAILLPEGGREAARIAIDQIHAYLTSQVVKRQWPVTFSIGVLLCEETFPGVDAMIAAADALMYDVKQSGKNAIKFSTYSAEPTDPRGSRAASAV